MVNIANKVKLLGPGLLYAGAAVGVSHLVQSTRAGADYGFDLLWILLLTNVIKYPFFEFGPRYAAATGKSLIDGYRQIGSWAVALYAVLTVATMFTVQAAVTIVTAGLVGNIFHINLDAVSISALILFITMIILLIGRYSLLDNIIKLVIIILALSTIVAVIAALTKVQSSAETTANGFEWIKHTDLLFLIAFIGWMPAPIDVTVWQSLWTNAKYKNLNKKPRLNDVLFDFNIGYIGTAFLAVCFLTLGALVVFGSGETLSPKGVIFAEQLITMYTSSIGSWSYYFIAIAALTTMLSTTITCLDAFPRALKPLSEIAFPRIKNPNKSFDRITWFWIIVVVSGSLIIIKYLSDSMRTMVDIATTLSFITAPVLAILNYMTVNNKSMPKVAKPKKWLNIYAITGIVFLSGFTIVYILWRYLL